MGTFDNVVDASGRRWQTKDGWCELRSYQPGDLFPSARTVSWIDLISDDEKAVGLVLDGVWTGIIGDPAGTGFDGVLEAGRALVLLLKTRLAEVTAERDRLAMVVNALRAWQSNVPGEKPAFCGHLSAGPFMGDSGLVPGGAEAIANVLAWYDGREEE